MTRWDSKHIKDALIVLEQIKDGAEKRDLPQEVYEEYVKTFKKVSTEVGIFDTKGQILLTRRPDKATHPSEAFPGMWHIPGVIHHPTETFEDAMIRLIEDEFGGFVKPNELDNIGYLEVEVNPRGLVLTHIYIGQTDKSTFPTGEFFSLENIPENIVDYHKDLLIPMLKNSRDTG